LTLTVCEGECFITNPPYTWKILDPLITHLSNMAPTWLLLPADMMHNIRMAPHMAYCEKVVSVGRVKWFGNHIWYGKQRMVSVRQGTRRRHKVFCTLR
jgi:hypothetical protein